MNCAIRIESLTKKYKDLTAVDNLDMTVKETADISIASLTF